MFKIQHFLSLESLVEMKMFLLRHFLVNDYVTVKKILRLLLLTLLFVQLVPQLASGFEGDTENQGKPLDVMGTLSDHDYFATPFGKIYLPKILLLKDEKGSYALEAYASIRGLEKSGRFEIHDHNYLPLNGHIVIDLSITSHLVWLWIGVLFGLWMTLKAANYYKNKSRQGGDYTPEGKFINLFEIVFVFIRDEVVKENIGEEKYRRFLPYLFSMFIAIAFMNSLGLLPWAATATADLTVTATLALMTFFVTQINGSKDHWMHIFWFPNVPIPVKILMMFVEFIGQLTKPFALAIRLFANMLSGKIIIITLLGLIFIFADLFGPVAGYGISIFSVSLTAVVYILKLFVALLQAYIFTLLSSVFIGMAVEEHDHAHDHETKALA